MNWGSYSPESRPEESFVEALPGRGWDEGWVDAQGVHGPGCGGGGGGGGGWMNCSSSKLALPLTAYTIMPAAITTSMS